ncbi:carbohydrate ABC transporter permease [Trinickia terrae]|uniref:carbohydrate ABC transporter permease n=1 Tax=Trinickia terrae TaxID=2571161 RepID=UPI001F0E437A|nr:carbohydrate ABC transporter permease [Trinickia terrae]
MLAVIWIVPVIGIVIMSVRPSDEISAGWWSLDKLTLTLSAWRAVWTRYPLMEALISSLKIASLSTAATMLLTPLAAYAFQFLRFPLRRTLLIVIVNAFVLPLQVVIIPLFRLWKDWGMIDNIASVLIPYVGLSFAWSVFLMKNFLEDFPRDLIDAAKIDGCGAFATLFHVVLPNALSPIFAIGILQFLWTWNSLLLPLLFLRTEAPLPVVFSQIAGTWDPNWSVRAVAAIITTVLPLLIFIVFQRQFSTGSMSHSGGKE